MKQRLGLTLLYNLNPDKTDVGFVTHFVHGKDTPKNRKKIYLMITYLRRIGWKIKPRTYQITDEQQYEILRDCEKIKERYPGKAGVTPSNLDIFRKKIL